MSWKAPNVHLDAHFQGRVYRRPPTIDLIRCLFGFALVRYETFLEVHILAVVAWVHKARARVCVVCVCGFVRVRAFCARAHVLTRLRLFSRVHSFMRICVCARACD